MTLLDHLARSQARQNRWAHQDQTNDAIRRMIRAGATIEDVRRRFHVSQTGYERLKQNQYFSPASGGVDNEAMGLCSSPSPVGARGSSFPSCDGLPPEQRPRRESSSAGNS